MTHCDKVLAVLADGQPHSTSELYRRCGGMILHSRVAELRSRGHQIVCERLRGVKGPAAYLYTWLDAPPQQALPTQPQSPRKQADYVARYDHRQRYRPFKIIEGDLDWVAGAGTQHESGIVSMLLTLWGDGEYEITDRIGILDTEGWQHGESGTWTINPFVA